MYVCVSECGYDVDKRGCRGIEPVSVYKHVAALACENDTYVAMPAESIIVDVSMTLTSAGVAASSPFASECMPAAADHYTYTHN